MKATDLSTALTALIPTRRPTFLWGPPGVGKSSIVRQSADTLGLALCDVRAVLLDPVDLRGIPAVNGDHRAHWCQPDFLPRDGSGVLFLDELAQAPPLVQSACLQLTLDRKIGEYTLPDGWTVIAASNRQEDRAGAHKLISPLLNRFVHLDMEVSLNDWQAWAVQNNIRPDVRAFLNWKSSLLFAFDPSAGQRAFPTPRSWQFVSEVADVTPDALMLPVVSGCIGEGAAAEYIAFRRVYQSLPDIDAVLANPQGITLPTEPSVVYAMIGAIVEKAKTAPAARLNAIGTLAGRMGDDYAVLLIRDTMAVRPAEASNKAACPAISGWVSKHLELFAA